MNIGIVLGRIGGEDGVALETEKWITVLEQRLGHRVRILAGALEGDVRHVTVAPDLAFDHPNNQRAQAEAFGSSPVEEGALCARLEDESAAIASTLRDFVDREGIDCLLSENANALPFHLTLGLALRRVFSEGMPGVCHGHDFRWERGERYRTPFADLAELLEQAYPPVSPQLRHAVINRAAARTLAARYGIEDAVVVPNVMDFDVPFGLRDAGNAGLRRDLGLEEDDRLLFQITRIVRRKGIETAVELVHRLADPRVKLVVTGSARDEDGAAYLAELEVLARRLGVTDQVRFAGERFDNQRGTLASGERVYSLSDAYAHATACTYFSSYEGFGNAFVEAVVARRPIFVNDYRPVYSEDIGVYGFETVKLSDGELTEEALGAMGALLDDPAVAAAQAERNFARGREHFSYAALERLLGGLFPG